MFLFSFICFLCSVIISHQDFSPYDLKCMFSLAAFLQPSNPMKSVCHVTICDAFHVEVKATREAHVE